MATTKQPAGSAPVEDPNQRPFPEDLPPRKFTQTWMQRNRFRAKTFFTLHYHSFSFRNRHGAKDIWRRISMLLIMLCRLAQLIFMAVLWTVGTYMQAWGVFVMVLLILVAVMILLVNAWNLALIGDAAGMRRVVGIPVRRVGLDVFLHFMALLNVAFSALWVLIGFAIVVLPAVWLLTAIILLIVGLMASAEPIDQYGIGV